MQNEAAKKRKAPAASIPAKNLPKKKAKADDGTRPTATNSADTPTSPPTREPGRKKAIPVGPPDASPTPSTRSSAVRRTRVTLPFLLEDTRKQPTQDVPPQRQSVRRAVQRNATPGPSTQPDEIHRTRSYTNMVTNKKKRPRSPDPEDDQTLPPTVGLAKWLSSGMHSKTDVASSENGSVKIPNIPSQRTRRLAKKQKSAKEVIELFSSSEDETRPRKRRRHTTQITPCSKSQPQPSGAVIDLCSDNEDALPPAKLTPSRKNATRIASASKPVAKVSLSSSREPHISRRSARQNRVFADDTNDESSAAGDLPAVEVHPTPATNRTSNIAHEVGLSAPPATSKKEPNAQIALNPASNPPSPHATVEECIHHMHDDDPEAQRGHDAELQSAIQKPLELVHGAGKDSGATHIGDAVEDDEELQQAIYESWMAECVKAENSNTSVSTTARYDQEVSGIPTFKDGNTQAPGAKTDPKACTASPKPPSPSQPSVSIPSPSRLQPLLEGIRRSTRQSAKFRRDMDDLSRRLSSHRGRSSVAREDSVKESKDHASTNNAIDCDQSVRGPSTAQGPSSESIDEMDSTVVLIDIRADRQEETGAAASSESGSPHSPLPSQLLITIADARENPTEEVPHGPAAPVFLCPPLLQPDDQEEQELQAASFLSVSNMQPRADSPRPTEAEPPPRVPSPEATPASDQEERELQDASFSSMSDMRPSLNSCRPAEAEPSPRAPSPDLTRASPLLSSSLLDAYRREERDLGEAALQSVLDAGDIAPPDVDSSDSSSGPEPPAVQHDVAAPMQDNDESSVRDLLPAAIASQTDLSPAYDEKQDLGAAMRSSENTMLMSTSDMKPNSESPRLTAVGSRVPSPEPSALSFRRLEYDQEEQESEEAIFQSMLAVSKEDVPLTVDAPGVGSNEESRLQVVKNHVTSSTQDVREPGSCNPLLLQVRTDASSAPVGEEDPGVVVVSLMTADSDTIDEDEDMYAPFIGVESQEDGRNSISTTSEDPIREASPEAKVHHAQEQAMNAGTSESSKLLRESMEALAQSLKEPIPTSHTPTALSHVTKCLLPVPDLTPLDPPVFIPGLLTQRLFAQSFLPPRPPAAAIVVPNNAQRGSQIPKAPKASDGHLVSPPPQKEDSETEAVLELSTQGTSESTTEVRKASSENRVGPVEETEGVSVQFLTTEVLKKDPVLEHALTTSRLIVGIIRQHQQPKPQAQIPMHDPTPTSMHDHDNAEYSSPGPQVASSERDAVEPSPPPQSRVRTPAPDDVEPVPQAQTLLVNSLEPCSQMPSDPEPSPELQPPTAFITEAHQSQPEQHEPPKPPSSSSVSSLATSDESPPPSTPTTSDPYDISHLYIYSMSPDDDGDINPEVYSKILDIPTLPLPETDDDDDVLLSHCLDYPDLDVAC